MTMPSAAPDVSVIVVSLDTREYLARCLDAIPRAAHGISAETIVVDNGSTDGTQQMVTDRFPGARLIRNARNVGFGAGNNVGARVATGRAILVLNSDCELEPGALTLMVRELDRDPAIGAVLCRLVNADGSLQPSVHARLPSVAWLVGDVVFLSSLRHRLYRTAALHRWLLRGAIRRHGISHDVAWGGGACLLIRRDVWDTVGGFDERFFMYWEDADLCKRISEAGYRLRYLADAVAVHHWGASTAQRPASMLSAAYRSRVAYFEKHSPGAGSAVARSLVAIELRLRQSALWLMSVVPSPRRASLRERAAANAACLRTLKGA